MVGTTPPSSLDSDAAVTDPVAASQDLRGSCRPPPLTTPSPLISSSREKESEARGGDTGAA